MTNLVKNMETHEADGDEDVQEAVSTFIHFDRRLWGPVDDIVGMQLQQLKEKTDREYDAEAEKRRQAKVQCPLGVLSESWPCSLQDSRQRRRAKAKRSRQTAAPSIPWM